MRMEKKLLWMLLITFAVCINVLVVYLLNFVWKLEFYYSLIIAFIVAIALIASYVTQITPIKRNQFIKALLIILCLCANYTGAFFVSFVWKSGLVYIILIFFITSIIAGIIIANLGKSLAYAFSALVMAGIFFIGLLLLPPSIYGHPGMIAYTSETAFMFTSRIMFIGIVFCLIGTLIGSLIGDSIQ
jgi:hypothetical protein